MVQRMIGVERISATALSKEVGVGQPTLSRWTREAGKLAPMSKNNNHPTPSPSPRRWTAEEKLQVVLEAASLSGEALGAFLRRRGLHEAQLTEWREVVMQASKDALGGGKKKPAKNASDTKKIKALERELRRKEKALAEVAALLALKKKANQIWGDEDDDTPTRSGT
jgi:transposase-like protein